MIMASAGALSENAQERVMPGRPRMNLQSDQLTYLIAKDFTVRQIAELLHVSISTIERRMRELNISISQQYSTMDDAELDDKVHSMLSINSDLGCKSVQSRLRSMGHRLQRHRVWLSIRKVADPSQRSPAICRRTYSVPGPLHLWHIDGNHKLVRWRFVIHGGVDGFSRAIVFLGVSDNNRAQTVLDLFIDAIGRWGLPSRVRSDKGLENSKVALYMLEKRGTGRGSHITGKSVHNTRIERLWRDMYNQCTGPYHRMFWEMEHRRELDPDDEIDLFCLHYAFKELLNQEIDAFTKSWNNHGLRTEHNLTPNQIFISGLHMTDTHLDLPTSYFPDMQAAGSFDSFGVDESDVASSDDEGDTIHIQATCNPLDTIKYTELLLRFPVNRLPYDAQIALQTYNAIRSFVRS